MKTRKAMANLAVAKKLKDMAEYDLDDALGLVGLRRKPRPAARFLTGMGLVMGGMALGAAVGMMLAPRMGRSWSQEKQPGHRPGSMPGTAAGAYGARPVETGTSGTGLS